MVGTVDKEQPVGSIETGIAGDDPAGQGRVELPAPGSGASCSSCGASIGHDAARCPSCGRVVLHDAVFDSMDRSKRPPQLLGARTVPTRLIDVVLETRRDSTWL